MPAQPTPVLPPRATHTTCESCSGTFVGLVEDTLCALCRAEPRGIVRRCACCHRGYTREQFLDLELPRTGRGIAGGLLWRQCGTPDCHNTLAMAVVDARR